jgi:menaquinone-dependent protoporphyrinogen oxidase
MSKTLIVYASKHGTTEKAVEVLKQSFLEATICNLKKDTCPSIESFDRIIVGGSIRAGRIQKEISIFCQKNLDSLLQKEVGLFICCMYEGEKAESQFIQAFPEELRRVVRAKGIFGGELLFEKMDFLEKAVIKKISGIKQSVSRFNPDEIKDFARKFQS